MENVFRVLVVDDEIEICRTTSRYLTEKGIESTFALDGIQALKMLERESFDVILTDLRMPRMHGYTLAKEIFAKRPDQLVVVMTGVEEVQLIYQLLSIGVRMVIPKPFSLEYLHATLTGVLHHMAAIKNAQKQTPTEPAPA